MTSTIFVPKPGDFELVPIGGEVGRLIHFGQVLNGDGFLNYEHARLYLGNGRCIQAEPNGASFCEYEPNDGGLWSTNFIPLTDKDRYAICYYGTKCDGVGYSGLDYFALSARRLHLWPLSGYLRDRVASSDHLICSQLVAWCYFKAGVPLYDRWTGYVTPENLAQLLVSKGAIAR